MEALTSLLPLISTGLQGVGVAGNIFGGIKNAEAVNQQMAYRKQMMDLANNPAALAAKINSLKQPLSTGLVEDVMNPVQAQLAERGLSASPAIATQVASQALAPYDQQAYNNATQAVMQMLGLPFSSSPNTSFGSADTSGLWKQFQNPNIPGPVSTAAGNYSDLYQGPGLTFPSDTWGGGGIPATGEGGWG